MAEKNRNIEEDFHSLRGMQNIQYIWDYYKLPLAIASLVILIAIYAIHRHLSYKDTALYMALVNVNISETLSEQLTDGFLEEASIDTSKNKIHLYSGLYLTEDETLYQKCKRSNSSVFNAACTHFAKTHAKWRHKTRTFGINHAKNPRI